MRLFALALAVLIALAVAASAAAQETSADAPLVRMRDGHGSDLLFRLNPRTLQQVGRPIRTFRGGSGLSVSPDGSRLAFADPWRRGARRGARIHFVDIAGWRSMGVAKVGPDRMAHCRLGRPGPRARDRRRELRPPAPPLDRRQESEGGRAPRVLRLERELPDGPGRPRAGARPEQGRRAAPDPARGRERRHPDDHGRRHRDGRRVPRVIQAVRAVRAGPDAGRHGRPRDRPSLRGRGTWPARRGGGPRLGRGRLPLARSERVEGQHRRLVAARGLGRRRPHRRDRRPLAAGARPSGRTTGRCPSAYA